MTLEIVLVRVDGAGVVLVMVTVVGANTFPVMNITEKTEFRVCQKA